LTDFYFENYIMYGKIREWEYISLPLFLWVTAKKSSFGRVLL